MAPPMKNTLRASRLAVSALALPLLAAPVQAPAAAPAPADGAIIPLPLEPIVPAGQRACTAKTASGLGYTVLREGTGPQPGATATVLINYIGYLAANGT